MNSLLSRSLGSGVDMIRDLANSMIELEKLGIYFFLSDVNGTLISSVNQLDSFS